jgi:hypothetical protein
VGATYNVLFLGADTRNGVGTRTFSIGFGSSAATSPAQSYAFQNGTAALGGYVLCTFTATSTSQAFTNKQAGFGYQLDGVLVGQVPSMTTYSINIDGIQALDTNIVISGSGGPSSGGYRVLVSTNLADWFPAATNYFDYQGYFNFTNPLDPATPARFYQVVTP